MLLLSRIFHCYRFFLYLPNSAEATESVESRRGRHRRNARRRYRFITVFKLLRTKLTNSFSNQLNSAKRTLVWWSCSNRAPYSCRLVLQSLCNFLNSYQVCILLDSKPNSYVIIDCQESMPCSTIQRSSLKVPVCRTIRRNTPLSV